MSGFICYLKTKNNSEIGQQEQHKFKQLNKTIKHRGPDNETYYLAEHVQIGSRAFKKDLHIEPQLYENDNYVVAFSGTLYNKTELRQQLKEAGLNYSTNSEAEIILHLYSKKMNKTASHLRGMFSFVVWDKVNEKLYGARDHFGIKPLFYIENDEFALFASEKKSIVQALYETEINVEALQHYLTFQFVPEPLTMSDNILKLEPGCYFTKERHGKVKINKYWQPTLQPVIKAEDYFIKEIRNVMTNSVEAHLKSELEVGSFLSGGIDSSIIAALAKQFQPNIKTFSVGFERDGFSEIDVAKETADKLGLENISYVITPEEYIAELPKIIWYLDDPLADPACVPLYFVAREAKKHVDIALSGEGADELFGGYNIYREPQSLAIFDKIPNILKSFLRLLSKLMPEGMKGKSFIERGCTPLEQRYVGNAKMFTEKEKRQLLLSYDETAPFTNVTKQLYEQCETYGKVEKMQYIDMHTWMRGDILLKADRMTMAHSLEVRTPFLDKEVYEIAKQIPTNLKTAAGTTKYVLRKAAEGIVPDHVLNRRKLGFPVPIRHWLKDEMNEWATKTIKESNVDHLINKQYVLNLLDNHCRGKGDYSRKIWTVIMFCIWYDVYVENNYSFLQTEAKERLAESMN